MGREVRASDADRQAVIERLARAQIEGRISAEEFAERTRDAQAAKTYAQLDTLTADLPTSIW